MAFRSLAVIAVAAGTLATLPAGSPELDGYAEVDRRHQEPDAIEAAFRQESYAGGSRAELEVSTALRNVSLRIFRVGPERVVTRGVNTMEGVQVRAGRRLGAVRPGSRIRIVVGDWPSGLYFAKVTAPGRVGFAPFVVRPRRLGQHDVAIVLPTRTWQAYNFRDDDRDGRPDTWYAMRGHDVVRLCRPFLNRGVPPHFAQYDLRFLRWLHATGRRVDVLAQEDLDELGGAELAAAYRLLVFPGHHEYVTSAEYDAVTEYRDRGGNLAFLAANNFFWRIDVRDGSMRRVARWRTLGRPEAALLGVQYVANDRGRRRGPWLVRETRAAKWLFAGIRLKNRREFSLGGIEIDGVDRSSPATVEIVAEIPHLFGRGRSAHMSYYETPSGAKVFSAGAFTLAGHVHEPEVRQLLTNLWRRLAA
jgi:hypothetical protein